MRSMFDCDVKLAALFPYGGNIPYELVGWFGTILQLLQGLLSQFVNYGYFAFIEPSVFYLK